MAPRFWVRCAMFPLLLGAPWFSPRGGVMVPHPRMIPKLISGQRFRACGRVLYLFFLGCIAAAAGPLVIATRAVVEVCLSGLVQRTWGLRGVDVR